MSTKTTQLPGQTIIEVIIATGIVALVMTALVAGMTLSIKNNAIARYKTLGTQLAQEGIELFRRERNLLGWEQFASTLDTQGDGQYCLNSIPDSASFSSLTPGDCGTDQIAKTAVSFQRTADIDVSPSLDEITVTIRVSWLDGAQDRQAFVTQVFREWR